MIERESSDTAKPESGNFGLMHDAWGRLVLIDRAGRRHVGVEPVRSFPISDPDHWISICDAEGHELACVQNLSDLPPQVGQVLAEDLARREFVPVIRQILRVSADTDPAAWDVVTDRGQTRFLVNSEDDVRRLGPSRILVIDAQGIRYLIPNIKTLDAASNQTLERYLE
jgi:hypothetical protein